MSDSAERARQIAELEAALTLPDLPQTARKVLEAALARLHGPSQTGVGLEGAQVGDVSFGDVIGGDRIGQHVTGGATFYQYFGADGQARPFPPPPASAAELSDLRRRGFLAFSRREWAEAADLLARVAERDPADQSAARWLAQARAHLAVDDQYVVARGLRDDGEWQALIRALDEMEASHPGFPDPDGLRSWAEEARLEAVWRPRFGPAAAHLVAGRYDEALSVLDAELRARPDDPSVTLAVVALLESTDLPTPGHIRAVCGELLASAGDPRPGVCDLPPPFVAFPGGRITLGLSEEERAAVTPLIAAEPEHQQSIGRWYDAARNRGAATLAPFELARYPVTNGQFLRFLDAGGYDPSAPWWDAHGRAWLTRRNESTADLQSWQRRQRKDQPAFWEEERYGVARPNHPVVGVTWYEAVAFCRWLTERQGDGWQYILPSEAEWEYAARGPGRRPYAWGDEEPGTDRANSSQAYGGTTAVGCLPAGATPEGLLDMIGNVRQWTRSPYYQYPYGQRHDGPGPSDDPAQQTFVTRGSNWHNRPLLLHAALRLYYAPDVYDRFIGFRLARVRRA